METKRKPYTAQEKVSILRRQLIEKETVSDLCDQFGIQPTVFYRWLKHFFEHGAAAFESNSNGRRRQEAEQRRIAALEEKLRAKNEVLAELMEEHVALKKVLGRAEWRLGAARHAGCGGRLDSALQRADRAPAAALDRVATGSQQQVLRLAGPLRES